MVVSGLACGWLIFPKKFLFLKLSRDYIYQYKFIG